MAWHYLPELLDGLSDSKDCGNLPSSRAAAEASSVANCSIGDASVPSKSKRTAAKPCFRGSETLCCLCSPSGMTSKPFRHQHGVERWISSLGAFPANRSPQPAGKKARTTPATCGPKRFVVFGKWDRESRCWKMYRGFFPLIISARSSETWRKRGTLRNGMLCRLPKSEPRICESVCGFSPIHLPTPASHDAKQGNGKAASECWQRQGRKPQDLPATIYQFPTPGSMDALPFLLKRTPEQWQADAARHLKNGVHKQLQLSMAVKMLPPGGPNNHYKGLGNQAKTGKLNRFPSPAASDRPRGKVSCENPILAGHQADLPTMIGLTGEIGGLLNPDWVELLMGWPNGWTALGKKASPASRKKRNIASNASKPSATAKSPKPSAKRS